MRYNRTEMRIHLLGLALLSVATLNAAPDTRLADAAMAPDNEAVRLLLKQKVDVNVPRRTAQPRSTGPPATTIPRWRTS